MCYSTNERTMKKHILFAFILIFPLINFAQFCVSFDLSVEDDLLTGCSKSTLTALHDQQGRDYLYLSQGEGGLSVISLSDPLDMTLITTLENDEFDGLNVSSISQVGHYLYVALGNVFGAHDQPSGLAIVNVTNPEAPLVEDVWMSETDGGAASVTISENYAYLCGLANGIIVLNISNPADINFVSSYIPPIDWPAATGPEKINARNIVVDGNTGYLAYDAGGMRIIDLSNILAMEEIGRYSNPALNGAARAYNNLVKRENLLYIGVDYAGMEVLDISNFDAVTLTGWWNPNELPLENPAATSARWFSSHWHANEIDIIDECGTLFLSCGRTEVVGLDISDPSNPTYCGAFGDPTDDNSSYGMTVYNNQVYVGLICTFGFPFPGAWAGVKSLIYDSDCPLSISEKLDSELKIYPNPANTTVFLTIPENDPLEMVRIVDLSGKTVLEDQSGHNAVSIQKLEPGIYLLHIKTKAYETVKKIIIE